MATAPLISVIVPTRNRPQLVEQTLLAIFSQTYRNFEVLVIDDGSTEDVRNLYPNLWETLDERFHLILLGPADHPGNGPSKARNFGIAQARGDFLAFCDDDDHWSSDDHLAVFADALATKPDTQMYVANQIGLRNGNIAIANWLPDVTAKLAGRSRVSDGPVYEIQQSDLIESRTFPHLNILIVHRNLANVIGGFWEKVSYEEDLNFFWRCLDRVETALFRPDIVSIHNIPNPLAHDNVSTQSTQEERWVLRGLICRHAVVHIQNPALIRMACHHHADTLRHFVRAQDKRGKHYVAWRLAITALLSRFSLKWFGYAGYLIVKGLVHRKRQYGKCEKTDQIVQQKLPNNNEQTGQRPFFSVIVPTRNRLPVAEETLFAIHAQTFRDFEVIVVDDGSSEDTRGAYPKIWERLDDRFRLVKLGPADHPGSGPSTARNHGISLARGRFIAFCDDDDHWCAPDHLAIAARALTEDPHVQMYVGNQIGLLDGVEMVPDWLPDITRILPRRPRQGDSDVYRILQTDLIAARTFPHLNILIVRRDVVEAVKGFWGKTPYEGDLEFFWRCLDRVDSILARPTIVSLHNIPDQHAHKNVSTQSSEQERWLLRATNCRHVLASIRTTALARRALALEGDTLRHLSYQLAESGHGRGALRLSLQALSGRFSVKWTGYILTLVVREAFVEPGRR
ncbi:MAG: glycosyltransferase [Telmatospirillum sp.]|nr:glycosyltransferase [Telmatospirillum sp.]